MRYRVAVTGNNEIVLVILYKMRAKLRKRIMVLEGNKLESKTRIFIIKIVRGFWKKNFHPMYR